MLESTDECSQRKYEEWERKWKRMINKLILPMYKTVKLFGQATRTFILENYYFSYCA